MPNNQTTKPTSEQELEQIANRWLEATMESEPTTYAIVKTLIANERQQVIDEVTNKVLELDKNIRRYKPTHQVKNKNSWKTGIYAATNYIVNNLLEALK